VWLKHKITYCKVGSFIYILEKNSKGFMGMDCWIDFHDLSTVLRKTEELQKRKLWCFDNSFLVVTIAKNNSMRWQVHIVFLYFWFFSNFRSRKQNWTFFTRHYNIKNVTLACGGNVTIQTAKICLLDISRFYFLIQLEPL